MPGLGKGEWPAFPPNDEEMQGDHAVTDRPGVEPKYYGVEQMTEYESLNRHDPSTHLYVQQCTMLVASLGCAAQIRRPQPLDSTAVPTPAEFDASC